MRARLACLGGIALAFGALVVVTFSTAETNDYEKQVQPAMNALLRGDVGDFFKLQPVYGGFAVLARLPFSALPHASGGGELLVYQFGVLPCLIALALVAVQLTKVMRERGQSVPAQLAVGTLLLLNPVSIAAVQRGHPEELLTIALVLGATLAAVRSRPGWAAVLLGLALATKQWAVIAVIPVLLACGHGRRLRAGLVTVALAAALVAPMALVNPGRYAHNNRMAEGGWSHASRLSVWWPLGSPKELRSGGSDGETFTIRKLPGRWTRLARPAVVVLAVALAFGFWLRRRGVVPEDIFGLLALLLLLRCLLDPLNNDYYHVPFLACLVAWEGLRVRGLPVLSLLAAAGLWAVIDSPWLSPHALGEHFYLVSNVVYLSWSLPLAGWLAITLFGRGSAPGLGTRLAGVRGLRSGFTRSWIRAPQSSLP